MEDKVEMALWCHLGFSAYLRPSENCSIQIGCVIAPVGNATVENFKKHSILLRPFEAEIPTKVGQFDDAVILDDSRAEWLGPRLGQLAARRKRWFKERCMKEEEIAKQPL